MSKDTIIATPICRNTPCFTVRRIKRIDEALRLKGAIGNKKRHFIATLPDRRRAYFLKPGKEASRGKKTNRHDMFPYVSNEKVGKKYSFGYIWEYLVGISLIDEKLFKKVLVLFYRLRYFLDHQEIEEGKLRYKPSKEMQECIDKMNKSIMEKFKKKLKMDCPELMECLHMVDMIGWNEDVKYYVRNGKLDNRIGMPNSVFSVISLPLMINDFVKNIRNNTSNINKINVKMILRSMQKLSISRGVCPLPNKQLLKDLSPYLLEK